MAPPLPVPDPNSPGTQKPQSQFQDATSPRPEKVAIIGSGMAGLVVAHLLSRARDSATGGKRFDVEVLEMQDVLSLDSASYTLPVSAGDSKPEGVRIGTGSTSGSGSGSRLLSLNSSTTGYSSSSETLVSLCAERKASNHHANTSANDTAEAEKENSKGQRVDLPMRAFAAGYYDNLLKMYTYLGVQFAEPRFVYSLSTVSAGSSSSSSGDKRGKGQGQAYFIHSSNNHILPPIRPAGVGLVAYLVEIMYLLFWYAWFTAACFFVTPETTTTTIVNPSSQKKNLVVSGSGSGSGSGESLSSYLSRINIPTYYRDRYFLPLMSSITTCTHEQLLDFPASDIIGYAVQTFRKPHYTVTGGVQEAEGRLAQGLTVRFRTRVTGVESIGGQVRVSWAAQPEAQAQEQGGEEETGSQIYDRAIIAVTPDVLGKIFAPLQKSMALVPTTKVATIVHTDFNRVRTISASMRADSRLRERGFRSLLDGDGDGNNTPRLSSAPPLTAMHMLTTSSSPSGKSGAPGTSRVTRTESIHEHPANVLVSTYAQDGIDRSQILHEVHFTRVLRTGQSRDIVNSIFDKTVRGYNTEEKEKDTTAVWKNGSGNVHVVGGWCWDGMVLLEGCIVSAMRVARDLGVDVPWVGLD